MKCRKCEICGIKSGKKPNQKRDFMAKFPLDEKRCKQWVKVSGNEDLVYVPIEKLHELKYVCGIHFKPMDFNKERSRLKRCAVPSLHLKREPLPEDMMQGFPLRIATNQDDTNSAEKDHNYCTKTFTLESDAEVSSEIDLPTKTGDETAGADNTKIRLEFGPVSDAGEWQKAEEVPAEAGPFSWQKLTEDVDKIEEKQSAVDDVTFSGETQLVPDVSSTLSRTQEGYSCNACHERITGFRYACVQCRDWDLCGACEARGEHDEHYVLRVPPHKTHRETQAVLAALRQMLTNEPDVALVKKEVKTEDPLAEAEVPLEPSLEELTQTDIEDTHQRQETSRTDDTYYYVASGPQKRKMPPHTNIQTSSPKRPKRIIQISVCPKRDCLDGAPIRQYPEIVKKRQCLDSAQKSYVSTSAVTKKNSSISTESPIEKNGSQIETGQVILLDDIDTTGEIVLASNSQVGHDVGLLELPSSSTSDKCMVLKVVGSQELRVNMTQLNDEEIMSATQPRQAKGER